MHANSTSSHPAGDRMATKETHLKNKPKRPLSAYNFFYKIERATLLGLDINEVVEEEKSGINTPRRKKARKHRKTPGMIGFKELAKKVSSKWREMNEEEREQYQQMFEEDRERYQREMMDWTMCKPATVTSNEDDCLIKSNIIHSGSIYETAVTTQACVPSNKRTHEEIIGHPAKQDATQFRNHNFAQSLNFDLLSAPSQISHCQEMMTTQHGHANGKVQHMPQGVGMPPSAWQPSAYSQQFYSNTSFNAKAGAAFTASPWADNLFQDLQTVLSSTGTNGGTSGNNMGYFANQQCCSAAVSSILAEQESRSTPICATTRRNASQGSFKNMATEPAGQKTMMSHSMSELEGDLAALLDDDTLTCLTARDALRY
jgi:hypothetical protein